MLPLVLSGQKVGVVLSGGGASGFAHIGVLKALEENNIPIDYITGTSIGALVGGLYAAGYSPEEIEALATSEKFAKMAAGKIDNKYIYYYKEKEKNASWITIKLAMDTIWQTSLPTNVISPVALDFEMMTQFAGAAAAANYNFDSLFVPFRCVASDIEAKDQVVFEKGSLSKAIRASMSYPFYLKPITVDGKLLFDGGLYNNFPSDIMYDDFFPEIIIGSNVSGNFTPPKKDNILSQIKNMLVHKTDYSTRCENGIIIEPEVDISVFNFSAAKPAVDSGYAATMRKIEEIKTFVWDRKPTTTVQEERAAFNRKKPKLVFDEINIDGLNKRQSLYVKKVLRQKREKEVTSESIKPGYYKVFGDDKIKSIYPTARYNKFMGIYDLELEIEKEKDLIFEFGGNFSSRPINEAYIGAQYNYLGRTAVTLTANSYFGKLYGSAQVKAKFDFPISLPFYVEGEFTMNRWDYFKSRATFFEDVKPSFLVQNERFAGINLGFPSKNKGRIKAGASYIKLIDEYYQTRDFTTKDIPDQTEFEGITAYALYERSTLNHKQYANKGTYFSIQGRVVEGEEYNLPGSTSNLNLHYRKLHQWFQVKLKYDNYYKRKGNLRLGAYFEGAYSSQNMFNNYTASILRAPSFSPTPESKTLFLESFRAFKYAAIGHKFIINLKNSIDLRLEGYLFQPYREILLQDDQTGGFGSALDKRYTIATTAAVYHSPIGPVSISLNYYHNVPDVTLEDKTPLTFLFHFGYIIFNKRAIN